MTPCPATKTFTTWDNIESRATLSVDKLRDMRLRFSKHAAVTSSLVVVAVEHQHDRTIIYGKDIHYHVVAPKNAPVTEGDTIECEPYGANFGWFVLVLSK